MDARPESSDASLLAQRAGIFWQWFEQEQQKYLFLNQMEEGLRNEMLHQLFNRINEYHENLSFEINMPNTDAARLIISTGCKINFFDAVDYLVAVAPVLKDWEIVALKPKVEKVTGFNYGGYQFDPFQTKFIHLENPDDPTMVAIRVCYTDVDKENRGIFLGGTIQMLEAILGEREMVNCLNYVEVMPTPSNILDLPYSYLIDIQEYISEVKSRV